MRVKSLEFENGGGAWYADSPVGRATIHVRRDGQYVWTLTMSGATYDTCARLQEAIAQANECFARTVAECLEPAAD